MHDFQHSFCRQGILVLIFKPGLLSVRAFDFCLAIPLAYNRSLDHVTLLHIG